MRPVFALLATLALTACQVDVEGARCNTPGSKDECPDGQACGNDGKCSTRAAECVAANTFCTPAATPASSPKRCRANPAAIETCAGADAVCGAWVVQAGDNCATNLVCDASAGSPACVCAAPTTEIRVDPAASTSALVATGAAQPPECQFKKLGDALTYARTAWLPAHAAGTVTVVAVGTPTAGTPVVFGAETFPLIIPRGVTLATSETPSKPADWIVTAPAGTNDLVQIHDGAVLDGFTIRTATATGDGIVVQCGAGATTAATLRNVVVDGGGTLNRGVVVTGTCGLVASQLDVSRAMNAGLYVNTSSSSVGISVIGGSLKNNGESGAEIVGGLLSIAGSSPAAPFEISFNGHHGVRAATDPLDLRPIALSLGLADVHDNSEVGILVRDLIATSSASVTSSLIRKNSATAAFSQYGTGRIAGGVLLWGTLPMTQDATPVPAFAFKGNTVCSNAGDAIGVYSNDPWPLSGDVCDATSNVFVNPAASGYYVYSTTSGGDLPAIHNYWAPDPPTGLVMKAAFVPSCGPATAPPSCN